MEQDISDQEMDNMHEVIRLARAHPSVVMDLAAMGGHAEPRVPGHAQQDEDQDQDEAWVTQHTVGESPINIIPQI